MAYTLDNFKWYLLDTAHDRQDVGLAIGLARAITSDIASARELVGKALSELNEDGLIVIYWSDWDSGYTVGLSDVVPVSSSILMRYLVHQEPPPLPDLDLFYTETEAGLEAFEALDAAQKPWKRSHGRTYGH